MVQPYTRRHQGKRIDLKRNYCGRIDGWDGDFSYINPYEV
jgi:hypothetical protein